MRKIRVKPYGVPGWMKPAIEVLRPRERLRVSQWAEKYRRMPDTNSVPGPWRNSVTPYLTEVMDAFSDEDIEKIIFCKPTQVGGTSSMENMLGATIDQDPGPTMVVYPTDQLAERTVESKLEPMLRQCKPLAEKWKESESKKNRLKFRTMTVYLNGANSPANLASTPIRYLFLDEIDKFPGDSEKEADPISLAMERTKTYSASRKIYMTSTPTLRTGQIWKQKEASDIEKHYFVPCPHCGKMIELKFAQIKWPGRDEVEENRDRAEMAVYVCQECGAIITDQQKGRMLSEGKWRAVRQDKPNPRSVAYWLNTLYSPFTRFSDIAAEFIRSKDDPELLHNFVNSWLAEPWEDTKLQTSAELVLERQAEQPEFLVPDWAKLLTAGVDVQENCLYYTVRAWGDYLTSQLVTRGQAAGFGAIENVMNREYQREDGTRMLVDLCLIDSGDQTDDVYDFAARNSEWCLPCKGTPAMLNHYKLSTVNKTSRAQGMTLVLVDGGKYKDMIASRMRKENGSGSWMVFHGIDLEYANQVTAEHKVTDRAGNGTVRTVWKQKASHADNHYLDCEVYGMAAADVMGVRGLFLQTEEQTKPAKQKDPDAGAVRREADWIRDEDWLE